MRSPQKLIQILLKAGYTQAQIAEHAQIKQGTISKILNGVHTDPRISTYHALRSLVDTLEDFPEIEDETVEG